MVVGFRHDALANVRGFSLFLQEQGKTRSKIIVSNLLEKEKLCRSYYNRYGGVGQVKRVILSGFLRLILGVVSFAVPLGELMGLDVFPEA